MKSLHLLLSLLPLTLAATIEKRANPQGIDVSHFQPNVDWAKVKANGISFAFMKATDGTSFKDPSFSSHFTDATNAGLIRGAYHFARPDASSGAAQANFFLSNGGGWSADGITFPGVLDIEFNPNGANCYGLSPAAMVSWVKDFSDTYHAKTTRFPIIYTNTNWWKECTGNSAAFASNPLWIARFTTAATPGELPAGWPTFTFWQFADHGSNPGDADNFNGDLAALKKIATG
ncbi:hypothetical protein E1B28_002751 [Marasmius oreades]|uniref:N,O-diacetylmuramidase n=1 Tax=Marasmius oreades TaxID=181124 RepID=A0A9P7RPA4_9AGAR|nr:uncharacterized protein E1B28_002751 [Marasmius oreades]KAG7086830.1 hypothetical protein E1B28_002751 [Marasmius oreades]